MTSWRERVALWVCPALGVNLSAEEKRADDNGTSCRHFCEALRKIADGSAYDAEGVAAEALRMPVAERKRS